LLINGAVPLAGQYSPTEVGPSPNDVSGWGLVNLAGSGILPGQHPNAGFGEGGPLTQGQQSSFTIAIPGGHNGAGLAKAKKSKAKNGNASAAGTMAVSPALKITLVWSDPAGPNLQNDLDLIVKAANGQERHGNMGT